METTQMQQRISWLCALLILGFDPATTLVFADETSHGCLKISEKRQVEEYVVDGQGHPAVRLKEADKISPGQAVLFTLKATNTCSVALDPAVIDFVLPERVIYLLGSASGAGSDIAFSINGRSFGKLEALALHDGGSPRAARADDVKSIRWVYRKPLAPNATRSVRFRASAQ
jgi:hypothetical protein